MSTTVESVKLSSYFRLYVFLVSSFLLEAFFFPKRMNVALMYVQANIPGGVGLSGVNMPNVNYIFPQAHHASSNTTNGCQQRKCNTITDMDKDNRGARKVTRTHGYCSGKALPKRCPVSFSPWLSIPELHILCGLWTRPSYITLIERCKKHNGNTTSCLNCYNA